MVSLATRNGWGRTVVAGIVGGLVFAAFEMAAAAAMMGSSAAFMPLRMIGAMGLGSDALDPGFPLATAVAAGVSIHMVLSIVFALIFASLVPGTVGAGTLSILGVGFGVALWLVNFYVIAPVAGWRWFPEETNPVVQFAAHAFFFGWPVAWYLARRAPVTIPPAAPLAPGLRM